ncbi:MAG: hypothetical protein ACLGJB_17725 [Blastocatellia bacterium]
MPAIAEEYHNKYAFTMTVESLGVIRVWRIQQVYGISVIKKRVDSEDSFNGYLFMQYLVSNFATHLNLENEKKRERKSQFKKSKSFHPKRQSRLQKRSSRITTTFS